MDATTYNTAKASCPTLPSNVLLLTLDPSSGEILHSKTELVQIQFHYTDTKHLGMNQE